MLNLTKDEWYVVLLFGVAIDLDHAFAAPRYVTDNGWSAILLPTWDDGSGLPWKSLFHYPVGAFVVLPLAVGWRLLLPFTFWGMHVAIDYFQEAIVEYSNPVELVVFCAACYGIALVRHRRWKELGAEGTFMQYLSKVLADTRVSLGVYAKSIRARLGNNV